MTELPALTEVVLVGGERLRVNEDSQAAESLLISAARGSIMELAWLTESSTGAKVGVNPEHVMVIRAAVAGSD